MDDFFSEGGEGAVGLLPEDVPALEPSPAQPARQIHLSADSGMTLPSVPYGSKLPGDSEGTPPPPLPRRNGMNAAAPTAAAAAATAPAALTAPDSPAATAAPPSPAAVAANAAAAAAAAAATVAADAATAAASVAAAAAASAAAVATADAATAAAAAPATAAAATAHRVTGQTNSTVRSSPASGSPHSQLRIGDDDTGEGSGEGSGEDISRAITGISNLRVGSTSSGPPGRDDESDTASCGVNPRYAGVRVARVNLDEQPSQSQHSTTCRNDGEESEDEVDSVLNSTKDSVDSD